MVGLRIGVAGDAGEHGVHVLRPDRLGDGRGRRVGALEVGGAGVRAIAVADHGGVLRGEAAEPEVVVDLGRARLAGCGLVRGEVALRVPGGVAGVEDVLEDLARVRGDGGVDDLLGVVLVLIDDVAVAVLDLDDGNGVAVQAVVGDGGIALRHLERGHARGTERGGAVGLDRGIDADELCHADELIDPDGVDDLGVGRVRGVLGGRVERDVAVLAVLEVLDGPGGADLHGGVAVEDNGGAHAGVERREQGEGLEARARLEAARRLVDLRALEVGVVVLAADHRLDVAVGVVDRDERGVDVVVAGLVDDGARRSLGRRLAVRIDRGVDLKAALQDRVAREVLLKKLLDVVGEVRVGAGVVGELAVVEDELLCRGGVVLLLGDVARLKHTVEDEVASAHAVLGIAERVVEGGGVRQADERRGLGDAQLARVLVEVRDARGLDAVGAVAVVDGVHVHVEDLVFGVHLLHLDGDVGFADLALERHLELLVREDRVSYQLLRDGGAAALLASAGELAHDGAQDALRVHAVVLVEALVLGVDGALEDVRRHLVEVDRATILQEVGRDLVAGGVIDARGLGNEVGVGRRVVGKVLEPCADHGAHREAQRDDEQGDEARGACRAEADDVRL